MFRSAIWSMTLRPKIDMSGPKGITATERMTGATTNIGAIV